MQHRFNPTLFNYLKGGRTVKEIRSFRPGRSRGEQNMAWALRQTLKVAEWLAAEEQEMQLAG